jgi:hypothetical protein
VIVFGESGVGKSSIINMLDGDKKAMVGNRAAGVTFSSSPYERILLGKPFTIFDTVGLNEGSMGTVKPKDAVEQSYRLISRLGDGVGLLVFVLRAPRIKRTSEANYRLFFEIFCRKKVPVVIIITGLEGAEDMDEWWIQNKGEFDKYGMIFDDHACITSTKGGRSRDGRYCYQEEYDLSKQKVEQLISKSCKQPWKMESKAWFLTIVEKVVGLIYNKREVPRGLLTRALQDCAGMPLLEAKAEAKKMENRRIADEIRARTE